MPHTGCCFGEGGVDLILEMKFKFLLLLLSLLLLGCSHPAKVGLSELTSTSPIVTTPTEFSTIVAPDEDQLFDPPKIDPLLTPISREVLTTTDEKGFLWVSPPHDSIVFTRIAVSTGAIEFIKYTVGCFGIIETFSLVSCRSSEEEIFLMDMNSREEKITPIVDPLWVGISSNEQQLYFEDIEKPFGPYIISSYDHINDESQTILNSHDDFFERQWFDKPSVSPDGSSLLVSIFNDDSQTFQVFMYTQDNEEAIQVTNIAGISTGTTAWSPQGDKFISYVIDSTIDLEIHYAQDVLLYDLETDQYEIFEIGAVAGAPGYIAWSPDGARIALENAAQLCIVEVALTSLNCHNFSDSTEIHHIVSYDWSPNSEEVGLVVKLNEERDHAVMVFSPAIGEFRMIAEGIEGRFIGWTK